MEQEGKKYKLTLKEMMAMQGKLSKKTQENEIQETSLKEPRTMQNKASQKPQNTKRREPTLKEMMAAQGRLSKQPQPQQKPAQKAQAAQKPRTEEEKKRQAAELAKMFSAQMAPKQVQTKEDKVRDMVNSDPEKTAELLREMFLKGKK